MRYAPWFWAVGFALVLVVARLLTNSILRGGSPRVPVSVSLLYAIGFAGLIVTFFWSMFAIAWWACLPVAALYGLTELVRSRAALAVKLAANPKVAHLAAIQRATEELSQLEPGDELIRKVKERADEIMRSEGWTPSNPSSDERTDGILASRTVMYLSALETAKDEVLGSADLQSQTGSERLTYALRRTSELLDYPVVPNPEVYRFTDDDKVNARNPAAREYSGYIQARYLAHEMVREINPAATPDEFFLSTANLNHYVYDAGRIR